MRYCKDSKIKGVQKARERVENSSHPYSKSSVDVFVGLIFAGFLCAVFWGTLVHTIFRSH